MATYLKIYLVVHLMVSDKFEHEGQYVACLLEAFLMQLVGWANISHAFGALYGPRFLTNSLW